MAKKLVAIVVPLSNRETFTEAEEISLNHLQAHLSGYDRFFAIPEGLNVAREGIENREYGHEYFGSIEAHRKLLFSKEFYQSFSDYEFLLIYHLDALVFSDELTQWCEAGYDYIAPPWIEHPDAPYHGDTEYEGKVGNGGFSLRRIQTFLDVLDSTRYTMNPIRRMVREFRMNRRAGRSNSLSYLAGLIFKRNNGLAREQREYRHGEDHFWGTGRAEHYLPGFKVAPVDVALRFAVECAPSYCFDLLGQKLPFGCHAFERYDRAFWEPYMLLPPEQPTAAESS